MTNMLPPANLRTLGANRCATEESVENSLSQRLRSTIPAPGPGSVPGSGVSDGGVSVPDVRGPSR
ncbi:hypothetical protein GBO22_16645, partial [Mycobacterium avium subsp. hominissuis]|nr:hypothetical protein [Mycobacterium avium subsp. hominissuis]